MQDTIKVHDRGETLEVPTTFQRSDLAAWYGNIPDEIRVDRIFRYDDVVRCEMHVEEEEWVEVGHFLLGDTRPGVDIGWVAQRLSATEVTSDDYNGPGTTMWVRDE